MRIKTNGVESSLRDLAPNVVEDRLLDFREVNRLLGSRCQTGHTARAYAARGLIKVVRINARTLRYSENSVRALIGGAE